MTTLCTIVAYSSLFFGLSSVEEWRTGRREMAPTAAEAFQISRNVLLNSRRGHTVRDADRLSTSSITRMTMNDSSQRSTTPNKPSVSSSSSDQQFPGLQNDEELMSMRQEIEELRAEALKRVDILSSHAAEAERLVHKGKHEPQDGDERTKPNISDSFADLLKEVKETSSSARKKNKEGNKKQDSKIIGRNIAKSMQGEAKEIKSGTKSNHQYTPEEVKSVWEHDPPHVAKDEASPIHGAAPELSKFLSTDSHKKPTLENTFWKVQLNIGREPGTWMPKTWGASGERLLLNLEVEFTDKQLVSRDEFLMGLGNAHVCRVVHHELSIAPTMTEGARSIKLKDGGWRIAKGEGPMGTDLLRFFIEVDDLDGGEIRHTGGDVYVPPGRVYCSCGYFVMHRPSGIKDELREEMFKLEDRVADIEVALEEDPFWTRLQHQKELFDLNAKAKKLKKAITEADVVEPDKALLRVSRRGDVGLTREGGVCCKVRKGPVAEYHILGRFSLASVDPPKDDDDDDDMEENKKPNFVTSKEGNDAT